MLAVLPQALMEVIQYIVCPFLLIIILALNALNSEAQLAPEDSDLELGKSIPGNICERMKPSEGRSLWGATDTLMEGAVARPAPGEEGVGAQGISQFSQSLYLTDALVNRRCRSKGLDGTYRVYQTLCP